MSYKENVIINRRDFLKKSASAAAIATGLTSSLWLSGCGRQRRGARPNIILIVIDTLRADHVGCYGYQRNTTSNLDRLARQAVLFKNAISPAPWTLPSVATLLTSQYPCVLGIRDKVTVIDSGFPMLSEVFKQHNYTTCGIISHTLLSARLGFGKGFDHYDEQSIFGHRGISSPAVTEKAFSFLRNTRERPFFLFLHYFDPHYDFLLHDQYNFYPSYNGKVKNIRSILELWRIRHTLSQDDIRYLLALYDSEIAFTDEYVGKLLVELKKQKLYEDSIIIVTSDHGEEFMERGWIGHTITLNQELIRVPLIMKFPGCSPRTIDSPVGLIDIVPTIYQYLGLTIPDGLEGKALDLGSGHSIATEPIFSETFNPQTHQPGTVEPIALRSITLGSAKLIYDERKDSKKVYNLSEDPYERNNLWAQHSERNRILEGLLSNWLDYVKIKQKPGTVKEAHELFTPEQRKQLESLGYL